MKKFLNQGIYICYLLESTLTYETLISSFKYNEANFSYRIEAASKKLQNIEKKTQKVKKHSPPP